jgi:hypothetical protein
MRFAFVAVVIALFATAASASSIQARCFPDTCVRCVARSPLNHEADYYF